MAQGIFHSGRNLSNVLESVGVHSPGQHYAIEEPNNLGVGQLQVGKRRSNPFDFTGKLFKVPPSLRQFEVFSLPWETRGTL